MARGEYRTIDDLLEGGNPKRLHDVLFLVAICRYIRFDQFKAFEKLIEQSGANTPFLNASKKIATKNKLEFMASKEGSLLIEQDGIYRLHVKALHRLKDNGYPVQTIKVGTKIKAQEESHALAVTDALLKIAIEPDFFTAFYHTFTDPPNTPYSYLQPDSVVLYRKENQAKLVFLEVERTDKGLNYIKDKMRRYKELAKKESTYEWWRSVAVRLGWNVCGVNEFCFGVRIWRGDVNDN